MLRTPLRATGESRPAFASTRRVLSHVAGRLLQRARQPPEYRLADSLSLREFFGIGLQAGTPDHSTLTNIRKRLPDEVFDEVFQFVLRLAAE